MTSIKEKNPTINPKFDILESKPKLVSDPILELIKIGKTDINEVLTAQPIAMSIRSGNETVPLFTKGNFSIVTGKAKSRKSGFVYMCLATAISGNYENHLFCENKGLNFLFDTEQSRYKVQENTKKIIKMASSNKDLEVYSLRTFDFSDRLAVIDKVLEMNSDNLNIVVIDGIIDLALDPILNAGDATLIIQKLMYWTEKYNCHIICVLHQNKGLSNTLLGHLGSFAQRKGDSVIEVVKDTQNKEISIVNPFDCREKEFESFSFSINENNLPTICESVPKTKTKTKVKVNALSYSDVDHSLILNEIFERNKEYTYGDLWVNIKLSIEKNFNAVIGDNTAKEFITYYQNLSKIQKIEIEKKRTIYKKND